ncbi:MAG TPA: 4-hydroxythreonine-4-phosphate dehydrogenase PdxA [Candidatus Sulfotelmatobacter sp.]|nr:4-hydroxythreonine-4-phosphate dehydrogenase PdxA [Candidatus Sulfotelmatobacter sp.]
MPPERRQLPLAVTMGEPAGIGGELTIKAWLQREKLPPFFAIDDPDRLERLAADLGSPIPIQPIRDGYEATTVFAKALPVLPCLLDRPVTPGRPDPGNAQTVITAIERAVTAVQTGSAGAVVTNPIQKSVLMASGFRHPGHTEFLAELAGVRTIMMLACPELRVVPVTVHLPLKEAIRQLTRKSIVEAGRITALSLIRLFGIARPRLVVAGLNPHAGESGALGREDIEIIAPAVEDLAATGLEVRGPLSADTLFHPAARQRYDAALCMYHDQALIPIKTLDFAGGVNVTLGLPFIRTSPDHGTALDIAGRGIADPASLIAAMRLAGELVARRTAG